MCHNSCRRSETGDSKSVILKSSLYSRNRDDDYGFMHKCRLIDLSRYVYHWRSTLQKYTPRKLLEIWAADTLSAACSTDVCVWNKSIRVPTSMLVYVCARMVICPRFLPNSLLLFSVILVCDETLFSCLFEVVSLERVLPSLHLSVDTRQFWNNCSD